MPSSAIESSVDTTALVPYLPARRASPDDIRSRTASTFIATEVASSAIPITRFPTIQIRSAALPVAAVTTATTNESSAKTIPTPPSAASSEGNPGIAPTPNGLTPAHRLDAGLGEQQERADDHREIGQVAR